MKPIESQVRDHTIEISMLQKDLLNLKEEVKTHSADTIAKFEEFEEKLQNVGGDQNVGTSVAEISALMNDFITEDDFCTSASEKLQFGTQCKVEYAPHARIFFRHNPLKTLEPTINLGFWLSPLPSGIITLPTTITLNGITIFAGNLDITATSGEVAKITLSINRTQCPMQVFNVLEVSFNDDTNFASTFLDWIDVEISNSQNCIILNRSSGQDLYGLKRPDSNFRIFDTRYQGAGDYKWFGGDNVDIVLTTTPKDFEATTINNVPIKKASRSIQHLYNSSNNNKFTYYLNQALEWYITQQNRLYIHTTYKDPTNLNTLPFYIQNVLSFRFSLHNGEGHINDVCCVHQDFSVGVYNMTLTLSYPVDFLKKIDFVLNNENYPAEFVDFVSVYDSYPHFRIGYQNTGYFLLHQSGNIIFVPALNSTFFIVIGKGRQINAYYSKDGKTIIVTYQHNNSVIHKILTREDATSDWQLLPAQNQYHQIQELIFLIDNQYCLQNNLLSYFNK